MDISGALVRREMNIRFDNSISYDDNHYDDRASL